MDPDEIYICYEYLHALLAVFSDSAHPELARARDNEHTAQFARLHREVKKAMPSISSTSMIPPPAEPRVSRALTRDVEDVYLRPRPQSWSCQVFRMSFANIAFTNTFFVFCLDVHPVK
jgi:hypothetical protein